MNIITSPTTTKNNNNQLRGGSVRQVRGISKAEGGRIEPIFTQAMASNFLDYSYTICIHLKPGFCSVVFQSDSKFNVGKKVGNTCDKDMPFVIIPNDGVQDRFCGNIQPFPELTSKQRPVVITVQSKTRPVGFNYPGFDLKYRQKPCTQG
ncbi:hypothetical protein M8J76_005636 [Diaphorina citri]|nr:hypothetical protein M8J75_004114 [Diaphorina citri]KAI5729704.1 hypothetical protein M8J76_005636 [Diaphorina citri]KAI5734009.1 hypothetical protein M8J77_001321 [Diaphorina citri]